MATCTSIPIAFGSRQSVYLGPLLKSRSFLVAEALEGIKIIKGSLLVPNFGSPCQEKGCFSCVTLIYGLLTD